MVKKEYVDESDEDEEMIDDEELLSTEVKPAKKEIREEINFKLVEVPTQHTIAIQTPSGDLITTEQGMVMLLNQMAEIRRLVA